MSSSRYFNFESFFKIFEVAYKTFCLHKKCGKIQFFYRYKFFNLLQNRIWKFLTWNCFDHLRVYISDFYSVVRDILEYTATFQGAREKWWSPWSNLGYPSGIFSLNFKFSITTNHFSAQLLFLQHNSLYSSQKTSQAKITFPKSSSNRST